MNYLPNSNGKDNNCLKSLFVSPVKMLKCRLDSLHSIVDGTGPPFRGSAIPGIRVRVRVTVGFGLGLRLRLSLADLRNGGPPEWWTPGMADRNPVDMVKAREAGASTVMKLILSNMNLKLHG